MSVYFQGCCGCVGFGVFRCYFFWKFYGNKFYYGNEFVNKAEVGEVVGVDGGGGVDLQVVVVFFGIFE